MPKRFIESSRSVRMATIKPHLTLLQDESYSGSGQSKEAGSFGFEVLRQGATFVVRFTNGDISALQSTSPNFGGIRLWYSCPVCDRRCGILYIPPGATQVACRTCWDLSYRSQRWSRSIFLHLVRVDQLKKRLQRNTQEQEISHVVPSRPHGMSRQQYVRLVARLTKAQEKFCEEGERWLLKREQQQEQVLQQLRSLNLDKQKDMRKS